MSYKKVTVLGHPFANIGRGHDARLTFKAILKLGADVQLFDIYKYQKPTKEQEEDLIPFLSNDPNTPIQIYTLNGDEVIPCFKFMGNTLSGKSYKIVYPQWELENYPKEWSEALNMFDEIWAPSLFVKQAISKSVNKKIYHLPLPVGEKLLPYSYGRRYFDLPESDFLFLFAFDFTSYLSRKNPWDVITAFKLFIKDKQYSRIKLVLKFNNSFAKPELVKKLSEEIYSIRDYVIILDRAMSDIETKSLIRNCDCYISLHRSEGFGRCPAEAMLMKIPVIATHYSGNEEYMNEQNSFPVKYKLVDVKEGEYPFANGQKWAQPNIEHAVELMNKVYHKEYDKEILEHAFKTIHEMYSIRQTGFNFLDRIKEISTQ